MRVTQNTNFETIRGSIGKVKQRMEKLQMEAATLKKINTPSDDPIGASKVLELRTDKVNNEQFMNNGKLAEAFLNNSEQAISELADLVMRAKEIAIGQASEASANESTRLGVAEEVGQLYLQAISSANRRVGDRYLFGGYKTQSPPVDGEGGYKGDSGQMMIEIAKDVYLSMNVPGIDVFNTNPQGSNDRRVQEGSEYERNQARAPASLSEEERARDGQGPAYENVNLFDELKSLRIALLTGDTDGIRSTLERFDQLHGSMTATRAKIGARVNGLVNATNAIERHNLVNADLSSNLEDADMAKVVSDLAKEETVYRSALQSAQKLIQPTLLDFLR